MARRRGKRNTPKRTTQNNSVATLIERKAAELANLNPEASAQKCREALGEAEYREVDWDAIIELAIQAKKGIALQKALAAIEIEIKKQFPNG